MSDYVRTFQLGKATITVISIGDLRADLAEWFKITGDDPLAKDIARFGKEFHVPIQCTLIQLPSATVLVDASVYEIEANAPFFIPAYQPPPGLLACLDEVGVKPESITHVVITHGHWDHFNAVTQEQKGRYEPTFPNARYYIGRADWESADNQHELQDPNSLRSHTLAVLHSKGLLELVSGNLDLSAEVQIIAAPGETPGHQIVRVSSEGQTLYVLGDLVHHVIEFEHPERMVFWADAATMHTSRRYLIDSALAENALLVATHIPSVGRIERTASGFNWKPYY